MSAPRPTASPVERVGPEAFTGDRLRRPGVWTVAFLADWCPFCRAFAPGFDRWATAGHSALRADVTDLESPLWEVFSIEVVPTVLVFRDGRSVGRFDGVAGEGLPDSVLGAAAALARKAASASPDGGGGP